MPKFRAFVIYDSKVEQYMQPWFARTVGEAMRTWETLCNDGKSMMSSHPADFTLFEVAEYDEATGTFSQYGALKNLGTALEAKKKPEDVAPLFKGAR